MGPEMLDVSTPEGRRDAILRHGVTPAQLAGITGEQLEAIYGLALEDLGQARFGEALDRLTFLVQQDPWERRYQIGLAHALQNLGQWESAGRFYAQALLTDATDAMCAYRCGECLGAMGDLEAAREAFEVAVKLSWIDPPQADVREAAQKRLDQLAEQGA